MNMPPEAVWAALTVGAILFFGGIAVDSRLFRSRQKEQQLSEAVQALRLHYTAMEKLDDEQTPPELLDLALKISESIHQAEIVPIIEQALATDLNAFKVDRTLPESAAAEAYRTICAKRPDLAAAFVAAMASAMIAFISRWPTCTPAFAPILIELGSGLIN